jgi:hypothetical protein
MCGKSTMLYRGGALAGALLLALTLSCGDEASGGGGDAGTGDGGTDTGVEDTDSWLDEYNMPFDVEPFQWVNVPGGLDQPTAETFAGKVLLVMFFQKW